MPALLTCCREFITGKRKLTFLDDAMQCEAKFLIQSTKPLPVRDTVQAKVGTSKLMSASSGV